MVILSRLVESKIDQRGQNLLGSAAYSHHKICRVPRRPPKSPQGGVVWGNNFHHAFRREPRPQELCVTSPFCSRRDNTDQTVVSPLGWSGRQSSASAVVLTEYSVLPSVSMICCRMVMRIPRLNQTTFAQIALYRRRSAFEARSFSFHTLHCVARPSLAIAVTTVRTLTPRTFAVSLKLSLSR